MEALGIFKFWRNNAAGADVTCLVDDARISASATDDDDDSLFDLDFKSPHEDLKELIESPRDVFLSKTDFWSPNFNPVTILRSAPKFKVFMLGFKKSPRSDKTEASCLPEKIRPAESTAAPVFSRDNSLRSKMLRESRDCEATFSSDVVSPSEKSVPKYLKLIMPFYGKASSKTRSADSAIPSSPVSLSPRKFGEVTRVGSFKIMTRSLGKSRSASAADGAAHPSTRRRDDSLLEQRHDGIQGAILHCKKSFDSSSHREYSHSWVNSCEEQKRCSI